MDLGKDLVAASATPLVLAILAEGDSYGYAIIKRVATLSAGHLKWTDGMLYPVLHRLERQGLVSMKWGESESGRKRKYYRITKSGRMLLVTQQQQWQLVDETLRGVWVKMNSSAEHTLLEEQIAKWREYLRNRRAINSPDVAELEDHLRDQVRELSRAGLASDEAFLVAVKRLGSLDALSLEFAREHTERLWKQLVIPRAADNTIASSREILLVLVLAVAAAVAVKLPALFNLDGAHEFYARNLSLFVLPILTGYFAWKRKLDATTCVWLFLAFVGAGLIANVYPFSRSSDTLALSAMHLPIALWLVVGIAYVGGNWFANGGRMNFVRFSGELFIYYVLIVLGGGVLTAFTLMMFKAIGIEAGWLAARWLVPCGGMAALIVGSWLVEAKQSVIENMAPVLTKLFTPLFTLVLLAFLATMVLTGRAINVERDVLIAFDVLLALVVALTLYAASARDVDAPPDIFDKLQLTLMVSALLVDALALVAITARISEFGSTPNRVAALGENLILLVSLAGSAWLYAQFLRHRGSFAAVERWQIAYLPAYSIWAALVAAVFPPLFGYR